MQSFGRLKLEGFMMSKSKIKLMLERGSERDDPRLPTLAGLRRRGILPETIREVLIEIGVKPNDATISFANLAAVNRKFLDPIAKRLMFVYNYREFRLDLSVLGVDRLTAKLPYVPGKEQYREIEVRHGDIIALNSDDTPCTLR